MESQRKKKIPAVPAIYEVERGRMAKADFHYYEHLVNSVSDAIISLNRDLTVKSWNRAAERIYGWTAGEAAEKKALELLHAEFPGSSYQERFSQLMESSRLEFEMVHTARDGRKITMLSNMTLLYGEDGEIAGCVAVMRDITDRKDREAELQRSDRGTELQYEVVEKLLQGHHEQTVIQEICERVMNFLDCGIFFNYLYNPDRMSLRLSASAGLTPEQKKRFMRLARGQALCGSVADKGRRIVVEDFQRSGDRRTDALKPLGVRAYACHPLKVNGEVMGTLAFCSLKKDEFEPGELALMKAVCGHVAVALNRMRNEADLKRLSEELRDKNRLITDFFTNISHEFKTPLSIILVDLQLMEYRLKGVSGEVRSKLDRSVTVMRQNALRLLRLIGNLLDVTKIDAGFMSVRLMEADAVGVAREIVASVGGYARDAGLEVRFESDCQGRLMPLDTEKMERILLNLLSNAIKHTLAGGHILVSLRSAPGCITFSVKDDGEGIPDDRKEIIFDRFRQVNTSLTRTSEGCGIGLSLTKALVELLRGRIWFESAVGRGSEFFVELPVLEAGAEAHPMEIDSMPRSRKVEMEFSDIHKIG